MHVYYLHLDNHIDQWNVIGAISSPAIGQFALPPVTFCSAIFRLAELIPTHASCMVS